MFNSGDLNLISSASRKSSWFRFVGCREWSVVSNETVIGERCISCAVMELVMEIVYVDEMFGVFTIRRVVRDGTVVVSVFVQSCS